MDTSANFNANQAISFAEAHPAGKAVHAGGIRALSTGNIKAGAALRGLGLLEWRTGKLTRIPNPPGKELTAPSWSYDGKRFVASMGGRGAVTHNQIVVVDLPSFAVTEMTGHQYVKGDKEYTRTRTSPVFQPETGNILYVEQEWAAMPGRLHLFNPKDGTDQAIQSKQEGFWNALFRPSFIGLEEVIFQAIGPDDRNVKEKIRELSGSGASDVAYYLRFGEKDEILFPDLQKRKSLYDPGLSGVTATPDGKIIIASRFSSAEPRNKRDQYNYEIFRIDGGTPRQLTNLRTFLVVPDIAYDGSVVAFGNDPGRTRRIDLSILDMKTGAITHTGLLGRIEQSLDFVLR